MALVNVVKMVSDKMEIVVTFYSKLVVTNATPSNVVIFQLSLSWILQNVLENPTNFMNPFQFEITFECLQELDEGTSITTMQESSNCIVLVHILLTLIIHNKKHRLGVESLVRWKR